MDSDSEDPVIARLPIRLSHAMDPDIQIHHFPLLNAPLQVPPQAAAAGKRITARLKTNVRRLEMHVPVDTRPEVWNDERASALGVAQVEDDRGKNQEVVKVKQRKEEEPRLSEVRMQSEQILQKGAYMVGIVRDGTCSVFSYTFN
jgi:DNA-directed RNA polymerase-3 subunit RPC5